MSNPEVDALLKKIQKGDEQALILFYRKYRKPLFNFVHRQISDAHISEELVQDIFLACVEKIRSDTTITSLSAYLFSIARHKIIDHMRKKKLKKIIMSAVPEPIINSCAMVMFTDGVNQEEIKDKVHHVLHKLPNEYSLIIRLKYIDGFQVREIANRFAMSFKSTESLLFRARKAFSKLYHTQQ